MRAVGVAIGYLFIGCVLLFAGGSSEVPPDQEGGQISLPDPIVGTAWLGAMIDASNLVVVDAGRGRGEYMNEHLPGAVRISREDFYATAEGFPGMFPGIEPMRETLRRAGISNDSRVVIYDEESGLWASRLFWSLEYLGHEHVAVLDGGLAKWKAEGRTLDSGGVSINPGDFAPRIQENRVVTGEYIEENLDGEEMRVIDARSAAEYSGQDVRAARGGHIPEAINRNWTINLTEEEGLTVFKSRGALREIYSEVLDKPGLAITHCQTGVRGSHTYLVLRYLGEEDVALYDRSWEEWGNDERFPVAQP